MRFWRALLSLCAGHVAVALAMASSLPLKMRLVLLVAVSCLQYYALFSDKVPLFYGLSSTRAVSRYRLEKRGLDQPFPNRGNLAQWEKERARRAETSPLVLKARLARGLAWEVGSILIDAFALTMCCALVSLALGFVLVDSTDFLWWLPAVERTVALWLCHHAVDAIAPDEN